MLPLRLPFGVTVVLALGTLFGVGGSAFAAIKLGEGRKDVAEKVLNTVTTMAFIIGIIMMIAGLIYLEPILKIFGATRSDHAVFQRIWRCYDCYHTDYYADNWFGESGSG